MIFSQAFRSSETEREKNASRQLTNSVQKHRSIINLYKNEQKILFLKIRNVFYLPNRH